MRFGCRVLEYARLQPGHEDAKEFFEKRDEGWVFNNVAGFSFVVSKGEMGAVEKERALKRYVITFVWKESKYAFELRLAGVCALAWIHDVDHLEFSGTA